MPSNPAGPLSATGIHMVDLSIALLGRPTSVWARLSQLGSHFENGDTMSITIGFESGATASLGAVLVTPFMGRLALLGSKGWMEIRDRSHPAEFDRMGCDQRTSGCRPDEHLLSAVSAVRDNLEAFGRAALGQAPYPVSPDEMLANVRASKRSSARSKAAAIEKPI